jgi:hypothetical protein
MITEAQYATLMERVETLENSLNTQTEKNFNLEKSMATVTRLLMASEKTFKDRATTCVRDVLQSVLGILDHAHEHAHEDKALKQQGWSVAVVDGHTVKENAGSFVATLTEQGVKLSLPVTPEEFVENVGAHIVDWFTQRPELFTNRKAVLFNYTELAADPALPEPEAHNVDGGDVPPEGGAA